MSNIPNVATSIRELFGTPCMVAYSFIGDGLWNNGGIPVSISHNLGLHSQGQANEVNQELGSFQAGMGGEITLTMKRFIALQFAALFPSVVKQYAAKTANDHSARNSAVGWSPELRRTRPFGMLIRPEVAWGAKPHDESLIWIPQIRPVGLGDFIYRLQAGDDTSENFDLTFRMQRLEGGKDHKPGTPRNIDLGANLWLMGDSRHATGTSADDPNGWEDYLPFGHLEGRPGAVGSIAATGGTKEIAVTWTAPPSGYIAPGYPVTGYKVQHRIAGSGSAFTSTDVSDPTTVTATISSLTAGTRYEVRVNAVSATGNGQQSPAFATAT